MPDHLAQPQTPDISAPIVPSSVRGSFLPGDILEQLVPQRILVPKREEVMDYIGANPQLGELLPAICAQIREAFGPAVELSLELYHDPEIDDKYLTLYVRQEKYETDIMDKIEAVSSRFHDRLADVSGYFLLATDFRRPRGMNAV